MKSSRLSLRTVLIVGAVVTPLLAGFVSYYASSQPDGLNKVAQDKGFDTTEKAHHLEDSPFAGYTTRGIDNDRLAGGLAGVAGVLITFAVAGALVLAVRRGKRCDVGSGAGEVDAATSTDQPPEHQVSDRR
jgi:hypothetical protein